MTLTAKLRLLFNREAYMLTRMPAFLHAHKDYLIIICDPKTDRIVVSYRDRLVNGKIKSNQGKKTKVVRDVLRYSRFHKNIDGYLSSMAETLNLPVFKANQFYQFLDGAIYNIAKSVRKKRQTDPPKKPVPSPFVEKV